MIGDEVDRAVLAAIKSWASEGEEAPGIEMLVERAGFSVATVFRSLKRLTDAGIVSQTPRVSRDGEQLSQRPKLSIIGALEESPQRGLFG